MSKEINDMRAGDMIVNEKKMESIKDTSIKNFNLQNFIDDLKTNERHLSDLKGLGFFKRSWNRLTGKNTSLIIESLDLNNQFINFSLFVNNYLYQNAKSIKRNQEELATVNRNTIKNYESNKITNKNLKTATERFNEATDRLQEISDDLDSLDSSKKELETNILEIKENVISIESSILEKVQYFYESTDVVIKGIVEKQKSNDESLKNLTIDMDRHSSEIESIVADIKKHISDTLQQNNKINRKLKGLFFLILIISITSGFLFYYL